MHATLSDDEDDSQSYEEKEIVTFVVSYMPHESSNSKEEENIDSNLSHKSDDTSDDKIEDELDLQTAYDQLCE